MLHLLLHLFTINSTSLTEDNTDKNHMLHVKETEVEGFSYVSGSRNEDISIQNMGVRKGVLLMRAGAEKSAMLRWETENKTENWSFLFTIDELHLDSNEHAAIYLRYTKEKPLIGHYKGGEGKFEGMVIGAELNGKSLDIVFAQNNGVDLSNNPTFETRRDKIDPVRLRDVKELTFKVICTDNHLKVEIYDKDRLVYDRFKMYNVEKLNIKKTGNYFGLIADYQNLSSRKAFVLKKAQLYSRTEEKDYMATQTHIPDIELLVRPADKIEHYDAEVRELIQRQTFMISFIKNAFGDLPATKLAELHQDIIKELGITTERMNKLEDIRSNNTAIQNSLGPKINDLSIRIERIKGSLRNLEYAIENVRKMKHRKYHPIDYFIFSIGCVMVAILVLREWNSFQMSNKRKK